MEKLVICDWSGTLSDDRYPVHLVNNIILKKHGFGEQTFEEFLESIEMNLAEYMRKKGVKTDEGELQRDFTTNYGIVAFQNGNLPRIYPDSKKFLHYLKKLGKEIAVLSAHPQEWLSREASMYKVTHLFKEIRGSAFDKTTGLIKLLSDLKMPSGEAVYVGDTTGDIIASRVAGIAHIILSRGYHKKKKLEREGIITYKDLVDVMESEILAR